MTKPQLLNLQQYKLVIWTGETLIQYYVLYEQSLEVWARWISNLCKGLFQGQFLLHFLWVSAFYRISRHPRLGSRPRRELLWSSALLFTGTRLPPGGRFEPALARVTTTYSPMGGPPSTWAGILHTLAEPKATSPHCCMSLWKFYKAFTKPDWGIRYLQYRLNNFPFSWL